MQGALKEKINEWWNNLSEEQKIKAQEKATQHLLEKYSGNIPP